MRVWIDTEFNGFGGDLISMALVAEDGSIFYESLGCDAPVAWVAEHVLPCVGKAAVSPLVFTRKLTDYLNQWGEIHIIADWPEDIAYFCRAMITGPGTAISYTGAMTFEIDNNLSAESAIPHNALADAIANKYEYLNNTKEQSPVSDEWDPTDNHWDWVDSLIDRIALKHDVPSDTLRDIVDTVLSET